MMAWESSRLKIMGLEALPTYKRVVAWFPGPVEDKGHYFQQHCRLNQGLDASHWRIYEHKKKPNGVRLWFSIDTTSVMVMERRPFSSMDRQSSPFWVWNQKGGSRKRQRWRRRRKRPNML
jgi:hypothetical protein